MINEAKYFATAAHAAVGQLRKYTNEPYIVHPTEVVHILEHLWPTPSFVKAAEMDVQMSRRNMVCAAWLHDLVEDTAVTIELIRQMFGPAVANLVYALTDKSTPEDGNRAVRKHNEMSRLAQCTAEVKTIKLADLISNTSSIVEHDPKFAKVYMAEKRALLDFALKGGDNKLWLIADEIVRTYYDEMMK